MFLSRKPLAKKFKAWICQILDELQTTGTYNLKEEYKNKIILQETDYKNKIVLQESNYQDKLLIQETEITQKALVQSYSRQPVLYLGQVEDSLIKFGHTCDLKERVNQHKRDFESFELKKVVPCLNNKELESQLRNHPQIVTRRIKKEINGKNQTELIQIDNFLDLDSICSIVQSIKIDLDDYQLVKMKHVEFLREKDALIEKYKTEQIISQEATLQAKDLAEQIKVSSLQATLQAKELTEQIKVSSLQATLQAKELTRQKEIELKILELDIRQKQNGETPDQIVQETSDMIKYCDEWRKSCVKKGEKTYFIRDMFVLFSKWFQNNFPNKRPVPQYRFFRWAKDRNWDFREKIRSNGSRGSGVTSLLILED